MFKPKKIVIPAQYGIVERHTKIGPGKYMTSTERVVLRRAGSIEVGGLRRKKAVYETRSERVLIEPARTFEDEEGVKLIPAKYKTVTRQVISGYKYEYGLDNYYKRHYKRAFSAYKAEETLKLSLLGVLRFFLPTEFCEPLIGDVLEEYSQKTQYFKKLTILWLLKEVIFTLTNILLNWFLKKFPVSFKIGN